MERQPAGALAPAGAGVADAGGRHGLEAFPDQPPLRALRCPQTPGVPPFLALLLGHTGTVDEPPDRYGALVCQPAPPAERLRQRRYLRLEGWPQERRYDDLCIRLWPAGR